MTAPALPRADWLLVLLGALLTTLAYPPFHLFVPSLVCLVPAVLLIASGERDSRPLRRHLVQGLVFGAVSHGLLLYWMVFALWQMTPVMVPAYVASVAVLAGYMALVFALVGWVRRKTGISLLVVFPLVWTAVEWVVGHQGDLRFPWLGLGTSLTGYPMFVQVADIIGARGVTLLLVTGNVALGLAWLERHNRSAVWRVGGVAVGLAIAALYGAVRERQIVLRPAGRVAVIQPNIPIDAKERWPADSIVSLLLDLSEEAIRTGDPALVVWPEAAVPGTLLENPSWESRIGAQARSSETMLLVGGYDAVGSSLADSTPRNSAFVLAPDGRRVEPVYHKRYLVPLVEQVPFVRKGGFSFDWVGRFGTGERGAVYRSPVGQFGIMICYESAFEDHARRYRRLGADVLINITNDVWFGRSSGPYQHEAHLVMRAIENRVGIVRAANSGVSEFVSPLGRREHVTSLGERTAFTAPLLTSDVHTIYSRAGDWVGGAVVLLTLLTLAYAYARKV